MASNVDLLFTNHINEQISASSLSTPALTPTLTGVQATVTIDVPINYVNETFYFKTDERIATNDTDNVHCYVDTSKWPTMTNYFDATSGLISIANNAFVADDIISKDFLRHVAFGLFGTHLGVDLFNNESDVRIAIEALTLSLAQTITTGIANVAIDGTDTDLSTDSNGHKFFLDAVDDPKNVTRALLHQILTAAPDRFNASNFTTYQFEGQPGVYKIPLTIGDSVSYGLTINPDTNQNSTINTGSQAQPRKYRV